MVPSPWLFTSDGNNTPTIYASEQNVLTDSNWTHLGVVHQTDTVHLRVYANGEIIIDQSGVKESNDSRRWIFVSANFLPVMKACPLPV